jgi:hypothetical protein
MLTDSLDMQNAPLCMQNTPNARLCRMLGYSELCAVDGNHPLGTSDRRYPTFTHCGGNLRFDALYINAVARKLSQFFSVGRTFVLSLSYMRHAES